METTTVDSPDAMLETIRSHEHVDYDDADAITELWDVWNFRLDTGNNEYLILIPEWMSDSDLGKRRPALLGTVEYDEPEKGAVLWDAYSVDVSIVENGVWDQVSIDQVLEQIDLSDTDHLDEPGLTWVSRAHSIVFERAD